MSASTAAPIIADRASLRAPHLPTALDAIPDWSKRIPALDGLRGVAILMVLMSHHIFGFGLRTNSRILSATLIAGKLSWSGVDLFFVLSGFLIGGILLDAKYSPHYFKTFYIRRACRIFPLYFLVTGSILLIRHFFAPVLHESPISSMPTIAYLTLTQNLWVRHGAIGALVPTWSLCVEEQFYLTIPMAVRFLHRRQLVWMLASIVILAPMLRLLLSPLGHGDLLCYETTPCRADALSLGVLAAVFVRNPVLWRSLTRHRAWLRTGLFILFLGIVYMTWRRYSPFLPPMNTLGLSWMAMFYAFLLLAVISSSRSLVGRLLCSRPLKRLGMLAYCTYLLHFMFRNAGWWVFANLIGSSETWNRILGGLLGLVATLVAASLSWRFFEKPILKLGHKFQY